MANGTKQRAFVVWLVVLVAPPAVVGGLGQRFVTHHAAWAVVIGVAYEAAAAIAGFFAVIARDISSRWQARLADRIDLFLQRKAARFKRRYREFVLAGLRFMDHKGLATVGPFTPELDAVFVDVSLVPSPPQQITPGILPDLGGEGAERRVLGDFLGREKPAVLAVVGGPGSGKTTLLRHAAGQACLRKGAHWRRRSHVRDIPVLLYLRDHAAAIASDPAVSVATLLRATLGEAGADEPAGWFERQLRDGRCLVLLDGLDEVAEQADRATVSAWAERQVRQYTRSDFVISSRPQGYQSAPVEGADIVRVCGFTIRQAEAFVRGWYQAIERHSTGTAGPEAQALAEQGADDLLRRLAGSPALYDLTVNPLLLTMIANVHRYRSALPGSRADLYAEICQVMLWRRQDAKRLAQRIGGDKKEAVLRRLAYMMMKRRVSDLSRMDVLAHIQPALQRVQRSVTPDGFLGDVSSNGVLIERETGQYAFAHRTFQEYLAAAHIRDHGLVSDLASAVSDDWWAETTMLYAAVSDADPIVRACLDDGSAPALALALDCVEQDSDVDPDLRERVNVLVISAAGPDADPERRRLFAGILLSRYMRQREQTPGGSQVCVRPIPVEIYRLFLADTRTPEPDVSLAETGIAAGMWSTDARAFVQWASALSGGQLSYRLPLAAELTELTVQQRIPALPSGRSPCAWTETDITSLGALPVLWLPPGASVPYEVSSATLASAVEGDLSRPALTLSVLLLRSRLLLRALRIPDADLDPARDLVRDLDGALVRTRARRLLRDITRGLDLSLAISSADAYHGARDPDRYSYSYYSGFDAGPVDDLFRDLFRDLGPGSARDDLAGVLHRAPYLDEPFQLADEIDAAISRHLPLSSRYDDVQPIFDAACPLVLGRAFSEAITVAVGPDGRSRRSERFTAAFIDAAGIPAGHLTADPAALEATLQKAVRWLADALNRRRAGLREASPWPSAVSMRLKQDAGPVFARTERPVPGKAPAIRIAALCLAAEADVMKLKEIGDMFRQVAAGITLLERRMAGERQAFEVIMLAVK
jgi:RecA/RadA recombinase